MKHKHSPIFTLLWFCFSILLISASFSLAYAFVKGMALFFHLYLPELALFLITAYLGLALTGTLISLFSRFFRRRRFDVFSPIIQALNKIARGDFDIYLDTFGDDNMFNDLVNSVNHMAAQLGQMESMRQEFISNVSHEIQSPLTSIRGFTQVLSDDTLNEQDRKHYLEIIESESRRLSSLTDNLLKLVSLDSDQTQIERHTYALDQQIRSVILTYEPQWRDKSLELQVNLTPVEFSGDEALLYQVWSNLLHNSIKFTPPGGSIQISLEADDETVHFSIQDSGIGISGEEKMHIFERFYKADKSRTQAISGSGLGLSIVKRIMELHHGQIEVESQPGKGSTFHVSLPIPN